MELSKRLQTIADMVTAGNRVADVGCDHGFVSIYLYEHGIAPKVYAMDVRQGPLERAREHIAQRDLSSYIETRLSDGVAALKVGEADTLICAGMGGRLMMKILTDGMDKVRQMQELILQPQSELGEFRRFLRTHGFVIAKEDMIKEEGKFYPMMRVVPTAKTQETAQALDEIAGAQAQTQDKGNALRTDISRQELEDCYGPLLLGAAHPVLEEYLELCQKKNESIIGALDELRNSERIAELKREQTGIEMCLRHMREVRGRG